MYDNNLTFDKKEYNNILVSTVNKQIKQNLGHFYDEFASETYSIANRKVMSTYRTHNFSTNNLKEQEAGIV